MLVLDHLDLRERRDAAPDHPLLHAPAERGGGRPGDPRALHGVDDPRRGRLAVLPVRRHAGLAGRGAPRGGGRRSRRRSPARPAPARLRVDRDGDEPRDRRLRALLRRALRGDRARPHLARGRLAARGDGGLPAVAARGRPLLPAPAQGRRHDAGRGAPLSRPSLQRGLREGEREVPRREPADHDRRGEGLLHPGREALHRRPLQGVLSRGDGRVRRGVLPAARGGHQGRRHLEPPRPLRPLHGRAVRGGRHGHGRHAAQEDLPYLPRGRSQVGDAADAQRPREPALLPAHLRHAAGRDGPLLRHELHERDHHGLLPRLHARDDRELDRARKQYIHEHEGEVSSVRYRLAGGLIGILAAVNEEVEWSYRVNLILILVVVFLLSYATYVSVTGALIVMLPSLVAQPLSEAVMYLLGIDMNINSLPVAAVGIGIGIDYGYYVLSRIVEELVAGEGFDVAVRRMFETTGKTVLFTGVSLTASIIFWVFFPMKFQAQMALLLVLLLGFHLMGALMFIPPMVSLLKPRFAIKYAEERQRQ
ncbi:MAG: hypothetical protein E6J79_20850, partial [Deltaproteobacteria bacterium]